MRIVSAASDPDCWRNHFKRCPDIFLNGEFMHHVVEADTDKGFVVIELWQDGKPTLEATGTGIAPRLLSGKVEIVSRDPVASSGAA